MMRALMRALLLMAVLGCGESNKAQLSDAAQGPVDADLDPDAVPRTPEPFLRTPHGYVRALAADATDLYFSESQNESSVDFVKKVDKEHGGEPTTLAYAFVVGDIAVDGTHVYYILRPPKQTGALARVPKGGGPSEIVVERADTIIGVGAGSVYFYRQPRAGSPPQIMRLHADGSVATPVVDLEREMAAAHLEGDWIYWSTFGYMDLGAMILRVHTGGGAVEVLAEGLPRFGAPWPGDDEIYGPADFVTSRGQNQAQIARVPLGGGPLEQVVAVEAYWVNQFASDGEDLYWAVSNAGEIWRRPPGGTPVILAQGNFGVGDLLLDDAWIIWVQGEAIYRLPR